MIDDKTMVTTAEILLLADFSKQRLSQLEQAGVVKRAAKDAWVLAPTIRALFADARQRSQEYSQAKTKFETIKAEREQLKLKREAHDLAPVAETTASLSQFAMWVVAELESMPAAIFGARNNHGLRQELEKWVSGSRTRLADRCNAEAESLEQTGKAATVTWGKDKGGEAA
jgi:hypothetical protein